MGDDTYDQGESWAQQAAPEQSTDDGDYATAAAYPEVGQQQVADEAPSVALGGLVLHPESGAGTHTINVGVHVHNLLGPAIAEEELTLSIVAEPHNVETGQDEGNAERAATAWAPVPALGPKDTYPFQLPMQVDPGHWHVTATLWSKTYPQPLASTEGDVIVQGHHARDVTFDESLKHDLGVVVTHLTRVGPSLYRVHFILNNLESRPVPAGLPVVATLASEASGLNTAQQYDLPAPIGATASVQTFLTLEGAPTGKLTATITVDPSGPSSQEDSLDVNAEEVHAEPHAHGEPAPPQTDGEPPGWHVEMRDGHAVHVLDEPIVVHGGDADAQSDPAQAPGDVETEHEVHKTLEDIKEVMDGVHRLASVTEATELITSAERVAKWAEALEAAGDATRAVRIAGGIAKALELASDVLGPIGDIALIITVGIEIYEADHAGEALYQKQGYCYGILFEALNKPSEARGVTDWERMWYDEDRIRSMEEAWQEGLADGRAVFRSNNKLANAVLIIIARDGDVDSGAETVLNLLWEKVRTHGDPDRLGWSKSSHWEPQ